MRAGTPALGFTLVELMIVVVIATILLSIAIPSYQNEVRRSRRTEAKTALLALAGREESYFSTNGSSYTAVAANLGYTAFGAANPIGSGYYFLTVCSPACAPSAAPPPSYTITAIPIGAQANDTQCASFSVDSTGKQYAVNSAGADATAYCWGN